MAMEPLLSPREAAEILGVEVRTLQDWRYRGSGPRYVKLSPARGRVRYTQAALEAWLHERERANTADTREERRG